MTRRSKREIERELDELDSTGDFSLQDYLWADLKNYYEGRLSPGERRLLDDPQPHLPAQDYRRLHNRGESQ